MSRPPRGLALALALAGLVAAGPAPAGEGAIALRPGPGERAGYRLRLEVVLDVVPPRPELPPLGVDGLAPRDGAERGLPDFVVEGQRLRRTLVGRLAVVADARGRLIARLQDARLEQTMGANELYPVGVEHLARAGLVLDPAAPRGPAGLELASGVDASTWGPVADLVEALRTALALGWPWPPPADQAMPGGRWQSAGGFLTGLQGVEGLRVGIAAQHRWETAPSCGKPPCALLRQELRVTEEGMLGGTEDFVQLVADGDGEAEQRLERGGPWMSRGTLRLRLHLRQRRPHGVDAAAILHECTQEIRLTLEAL